MNQRKIETIRRFFANSYTKNDLRKLFIWFNSKKGNSEIVDELDINRKQFNDREISFENIDSEKIFATIKGRIRHNKIIKIRRKAIKFIPYAAMIAIVIGFMIFFSNEYGFLKFNHNNKYTSVATENGQRLKVILPDSSVVWLNSGTTLKYSYSSKRERSVILNGQGFFEVVPDKRRPFIVRCKDINVKVLGTRFDVNGYPENENISVVLESGVVKLRSNQNKVDYKLKPGEQADYNINSKTVNIYSADIEKSTSWKDGKLIFRNDPMKYVISQLERWYNINVEVKDSEVYNSIFTGTVKNESYQQIFNLIMFTCPVKCEFINENTIEEKPKIIMTINKK